MAQEAQQNQLEFLQLTTLVPRALVTRLLRVCTEHGDSFDDVIVDALTLHADTFEAGEGASS